LGNEVVTVHVGPKRKAFTVHKKLLCDRSDYFSKVFNGGFKEANGEMHLPEDNPTTFGHLVNYIYRNTLPQLPSKSPNMDEKFEYSIGLEGLFLLAEKVCMNELSNKTMDAIQDHDRVHKLCSSCYGLESIYQITHENSKLRIYRLLSCMGDYLDQRNTEKDTTEVGDMLLRVPEIARDFVLFQVKHAEPLKANTLPDPESRSTEGYGRCFFHRHAKGERCHLEAS
jgi:hypothetical protein